MPKIKYFKQWIGDEIYWVDVDYNPKTNVCYAEIYKPKKITNVQIDEVDGISYDSDEYGERIAFEDEIDSCQPMTWICGEVFSFSSRERAEKFVKTLSDENRMKIRLKIN